MIDTRRGQLNVACPHCSCVGPCSVYPCLGLHSLAGCSCNGGSAFNAGRPGQGRPLGLLVAWLEAGKSTSREQHMRSMESPLAMSRSARQRARDWLVPQIGSIPLLVGAFEAGYGSESGCHLGPDAIPYQWVFRFFFADPMPSRRHIACQLPKAELIGRTTNNATSPTITATDTAAHDEAVFLVAICMSCGASRLWGLYRRH